MQKTLVLGSDSESEHYHCRTHIKLNHRNNSALNSLCCQEEVQVKSRKIQEIIEEEGYHSWDERPEEVLRKAEPWQFNNLVPIYFQFSNYISI